jgi:asparagine N-glycosylation enzyme membrane subunit Stt3
VLGSFVGSFLLSGFPHSRATVLLVIPAILALLGMLDTVRCVRPRWGFYHGGVILLLLMDTLAVCLILSFLLLPYLF